VDIHDAPSKTVTDRADQSVRRKTPWMIARKIYLAGFSAAKMTTNGYA
jgi:hypothetical protein